MRIAQSDLVKKDILRPLLTIHDGLVFEVKEGHMEECRALVVGEMETPPFPAPVEFKVSCKRGYRWGSLEKYE